MARSPIADHRRPRRTRTQARGSRDLSVRSPCSTSVLTLPKENGAAWHAALASRSMCGMCRSGWWLFVAGSLVLAVSGCGGGRRKAAGSASALQYLGVGDSALLAAQCVRGSTACRVTYANGDVFRCSRNSIAGMEDGSGAVKRGARARIVPVPGPAYQRRTGARCSGAALSVFPTSGDYSMTGEHGHSFILLNRSRFACFVRGYPRVSFYAHRVLLPFVQRNGGGYVTRRPSKRVLLEVGAQAYFLAAKYRCDGQVAAEASSVDVSLPGGTGRVTDVLPSGESVYAFDYCRRYASDARVDPGNYVDVSPVVAKPASMTP